MYAWVELTEHSVRGRDLSGEDIWQIGAFANERARTNQGAAIQIFAERLP